jgi:hypothetical protein
MRVLIPGGQKPLSTELERVALAAHQPHEPDRLDQPSAWL